MALALGSAWRPRWQRLDGLARRSAGARRGGGTSGVDARVVDRARHADGSRGARVGGAGD